MDLAWLWENEQLSDVKLRLVCPQGVGEKPAAKRRKQDGTHDRGACVMELSLHRVVLAATSEYWKSRLLRWEDNPRASRRQAAAKAFQAAQAETNCWVLEEQVDSIEEATAVKHVLRSAYTRTLQESSSAILLLQMAVWADRWDMPLVLSACLTAAAAIKDLSLPDLEQLLQYPLPDSITGSDKYMQLQQRLGNTVCSQVGPAQDALVNRHKLKSFCNLSLEAVLL